MSGTRPDSGERGPRVGAALLLSHPLATPPRGESPPGLAPDEAHHSASAQRTLPDWLVQAPRASSGSPRIPRGVLVQSRQSVSFARKSRCFFQVGNANLAFGT